MSGSIFQEGHYLNVDAYLIDASRTFQYDIAFNGNKPEESSINHNGLKVFPIEFTQSLTEEGERIWRSQGIWRRNSRPVPLTKELVRGIKEGKLSVTVVTGEKKINLPILIE